MLVNHNSMLVDLIAASRNSKLLYNKTDGYCVGKYKAGYIICQLVQNTTL